MFDALTWGNLTIPRSTGSEVEFVTIMSFHDWSAVEAFAGPATTGSVVPASAQRLLARYDQHFSTTNSSHDTRMLAAATDQPARA